LYPPIFPTTTDNEPDLMLWFPRSKKWTGWELNPRPQLSTTYLKGRNVKENFLEIKSRPVHSFLCVFRGVVSQTKFLEKARYRHTSIKKYREGIKQVLVLYYALCITIFTAHYENRGRDLCHLGRRFS
jgi:hypothetical protein